ncbi:hypothetical protein ACFX2B_008535 [Malus domestica]
MGEEGEAGGELEAEAAEEVWARWAGGGGHGLEVGPGGLLNEAVANGDFVAGVVGGGNGGGIHGGGGGEQVSERSVGFGALEGEELQVQLEWLWARNAAVLGGEAGVVEALELGRRGRSGGGGKQAEFGGDHNGCADRVSAAELPRRE